MFRSYTDTVRTGKPDKVSKEVSIKYYCDFCDVDNADRAWDSEPDLEIHRRYAHKKELLRLISNDNSFICTVCLYIQENKTALTEHIKTHHLLSPRNSSVVKREIFICDYCNKLFFNKQLLSIHISALHMLSTKEKKTAIATCPACFNNVPIKTIWFHFLQHGIIHTACCPICMKTFDNTDEVLKHVESHPGFYNCNICCYETKKEHLFLNHLEKHKRKVSLEGRSGIEAVAKYFVPQIKYCTWSGKFLNIFKGIKPAPEIRICILCRAMCVTDDEMLQHIYGDHSPSNTVEVKTYLCACGEEFSNNILLKHHIFTLKEPHEVFNGTREELDKMIEEQKIISETNFDPDKTWVEVEIESTNSGNNSVNAPILKEAVEDVEIPAHVREFQHQMTDDTHGKLNDNEKSTNDTEESYTVTSQHKRLKPNNDMCDVNDSSNDALEINCEPVNDSNNDEFKSCNDKIYRCNDSEFIENVDNCDTDKESYEQVIIIKEGDVHMTDESVEHSEYVPGESEQFVFKILGPADSDDEGANAAEGNLYIV